MSSSTSEEREPVLVVGWFSFELMGSTAGDVMAADVACTWLRDAGYAPVRAAFKPEGTDEIATADLDPGQYGTVVFVCGPIGDGPPLNEFLDRFRHARVYALDVTLLQERSEWNPFEHIVERDSTQRVNPDIAFAARHHRVPVIGLVLVGPQAEYPTNRHGVAEAALTSELAHRNAAVVPIDTRLDVNAGGLWSAAQIESLIGKMDVVLTTRLHGAVLALRQGVPPVVVDSVPGGSKVLAQMREVGWPLAFDVADLDESSLRAAVDFALTAEARELAQRTATNAERQLRDVRDEFVSAVRGHAADP